MSTAESLTLVLDGGTTNTRAHLFVGDRRLSVAARPIGVRDTARSGSREALIVAVKESIAEALQAAGRVLPEVDTLCAAGMLTSEVGLAEVPHVVAPVGHDGLARHVMVRTLGEVADVPMRFVPGVKTVPAVVDRGHLATMDMMRGEEVATFGILQQTGRRGPLLLLLPGSHTKLVAVDGRGRIAASYTTLAGEALASLARHTVLAGSTPPELPETPPADCVAEGMEFARQWGLMRSAFAVRLQHVFLGADPVQCAAFLSGAVIEADVESLLRWRGINRRAPLLVGGRQPLRRFYAQRLRGQCDLTVVELDDQVAAEAPARGALSVVRRSLRSA
ncbi:MAG: 2-dehydro-3-deoxygalactonokinase [Pirellulales bacterium]